MSKKLTEKFWVAKHKTAGVLIDTACKSRLNTVSILEKDYYEDWFMDDNFEIVLIEIKEVTL